MFDHVLVVLPVHNAQHQLLLEEVLGRPSLEHLDKLLVPCQLVHFQELGFRVCGV